MTMSGLNIPKALFYSSILCLLCRFAMIREFDASFGVIFGFAFMCLVWERISNKTYLDPASATLVNPDKTKTIAVTSMLDLEGTVQYDRLESLFKEVFFKYLSFTCILKESWIFWPRMIPIKNLSYDEIFKRNTFWNDDEKTEDDIRSFASKIANSPLDVTKPLWELHVFPKVKKSKEEGFRTICVLKFHHCLADGYAIMRTLMHAVEPFAKPQSSDKNTTKKTKSKKKKIACEKKNVIKPIIELLAPNKDPASFMKDRTRNLSLDDKVNVQWHTINRSFDEIKELAHGWGMSVNAMLISLVQGTLRRFADDKGHHFDEKMSTVVWIGLAPMQTLYTHHSEIPIERGNKTLAACYTKLPFEIVDPKERALESNKRFVEAGTSLQPMVCHILMVLVGLLPPCLGALIWGSVADKASLSCSSVPGPKHDVTLAGLRVNECAFVVTPQKTLNVMTTIASLKDKVTFCIAAADFVFTEEDCHNITHKYLEEEIIETFECRDNEPES
eukprot:TRINITY_DN17556_c0_g1_i1.p1 TRINITY_DN17556_c0_g1~~TRINITY_DN17556_c0_g1_i1.p1  ORF type:complete len:502 (+),score=143.61 TRINITY_DN17556_c0_g1_i1:106-1611(+)